MITLIIGAPETESARLRQLLLDITPAVAEADSCARAQAAIRHAPTRLVICERDLPDGTWRDVLDVIAAQPDPPLLIVTSRLADDRLWCEVLNLGGYDVLAQPFDPEEVRRVAGLARDHWLKAHGLPVSPPAVVFAAV